MICQSYIQRRVNLTCSLVFHLLVIYCKKLRSTTPEWLSLSTIVVIKSHENRPPGAEVEIQAHKYTRHVCVCVYIYIYIYIYTYIHTYTENGDCLSLHILLKKGKRPRNEICEQMNISWNFLCQVSFRKNTVCFTENRHASYFQRCIVGGTTELITEEYFHPVYVASYLLGVNGECLRYNSSII